MRLRTLCFLAAVVGAMGALPTKSAHAQTYSVTISYPDATSTLSTNSTVTAQGIISVNPTTGTPPNAMRVQIKDSGGTVYTGTGGVVSIGQPGMWQWTVSIFIPSTAKTGLATCTAQGSTNGGTTWNGGAATTNPTIQ